MRLPGYYRGRKAAVRMIRVLRMPGVRVDAMAAARALLGSLQLASWKMMPSV